MSYVLVPGSSWEFQSGGPPEDPLWKEVLLYMLISFAFMVALYSTASVFRWLS